MASFVYVPVVCSRKLREVAETVVNGKRKSRVTGAGKTVVFMDWLKVKKSTVDFLNIPKSFDGSEGQEFEQFNAAVEGSTPDSIKIIKVKDHDFRLFSGIDDASGETRQRKGSERSGGIIRVSPAVQSAVIPTTRINPASGTISQSNKRINIAFPAYFTRLMIRQCLGHLCSFTTSRTKGYYLIENVKYAMVKKAWNGLVPGADNGAWFTATVPSGLTPDNPDIPGDTGTPVAGGGVGA